MKFSIRDLLLVTVIVALAVAWGLDHRRQAAEIEQFNSVDDVNHEGVFDKQLWLSGTQRVAGVRRVVDKIDVGQA